ncbi:MAG: glycoside hydrolase family 130 protein [Verrucomicrobiota bacterium]
MSDLALRFDQNPLLVPSQITPSHPGLRVEYLLNPGAFQYDGKTYLLVRTAERPEPQSGKTQVPIMEGGKIQILNWDDHDPLLSSSDPREYRYNGQSYLSTLSHLRFFVSADGKKFAPAGQSDLWGSSTLEAFGIEDCRVTTFEDGRYFLTYTAVSSWGYGVGLRETSDWSTIKEHGMVLAPANKDAAIFERRIGGKYACLHRPSGVVIGGHFIWLAFSEDLLHWEEHRPVAKTRPGMWDSARIGAGAAPIYTEHGWLEIYHGADEHSRYCLGALLLDLREPWKVLARSEVPIMEPIEEYEKTGFFGNVIFTNGHVVQGDMLTLYYGASDSIICGSSFSIRQILKSLA